MIAGVFTATMQWPILLLIPVCLAGIFVLYNRLNKWWLLIYIVSIFIMYVRTDTIIQSDFSNLESIISTSEDCTVTGIVDKVFQYSDYQKIYIYNPKIVKNSEEYRLSGVVLNASDAYFECGETIKIKGTIASFNKATNDGQFDTEKYYKSIGITARVNPSKLQKLEEEDGFHSFVNSIKERLDKSYTALDDKKHSGIYKAMVIGKKEDIDTSVKDLYATSGIGHILAISGLHIAVIGMGLYTLLRRFGVTFLNASILSMILILIYGNIAGNGTSTVRAVIMFAFFLGANILGRTYDLITAAAFSAIYIVFCQPCCITSTGFLLSFGAITAIGTILPVFKEAVQSRRIDGVIASLSISLVTIPITAWSYYEIPVYAILLNVVVLAFVSIAMTGAVLGGVAGCVSSIAGTFFVGITHYILDFYEILCTLFLKLPGSVAITGKPSVLSVVLYYMILISFVVAVKKKKTIFKALPAVAAIMLIILCYQNNDKARIYMLDVSQGESIYVNISDKHNMLIDCGSSDVKMVGKYRIIPFLKSHGISELEYIVLTHSDDDHTNALTELMNSSISIKNIIISEVLREDEKMNEILKNSSIPVMYVKSGDILCFPDATITVLYPDSDNKSMTKDTNSLSLILKAEIKENKILFTGDSEELGENYTLEHKMLEKYDILKVAHHGSKSSTSEEFLNKVQPDIALISCGKNNMYGHPHAETIDRLQKYTDKIYITKDAGQITVDLPLTK